MAIVRNAQAIASVKLYLRNRENLSGCVPTVELHNQRSIENVIAAGPLDLLLIRRSLVVMNISQKKGR